jgi:predicted peptidase
MHKHILLSCITFFLFIVAVEGQLYDLFEVKTIKDEAGKTMNYRLLSPDDRFINQEKVPILIFLHGAGERGDNNTAQLVHVLTNFVQTTARVKYPCYIIAPQCPKNEWWTAGSYQSDGSISWEEEPSYLQKMTMSIVDELIEKEKGDPNRIYVGGLSMGGMGTWDLIAHYPNRIAAAFPICGWGNPVYANKIKHIPVWAFHGADDPVVPPEGTSLMIQALKQVGGQPIYTEYEGVKHASWEFPFSDQTYVFDWLFAQSKE